MAHHQHRSMRLKKPKLLHHQRPRQPLSHAVSDESSDTSIDVVNQTEAAETLEARRLAAEEARKFEKANLLLNMEVNRVGQARGLAPPAIMHASSSFGSVAVPPESVTSEQDSYLERLASQARNTDHADDSDDEHGLQSGKRAPPGVVRKIAEHHHRQVEKREKKRRVERLRRIAALDPLEEGTRGHGEAKETKFLTLIRKYGNRAQEESRNAQPSGAVAATYQEGKQEEEETSADSSPTEEQDAYLVDTLNIVDPGVSAAEHLSNIGNSLIFPNIPGLYDRRPVIDLPTQDINPDATPQETQLQLEEGMLHRSAPTTSDGRPKDDDDLHLDAYIHELLTKRQKFKRAMQGVWAFLKTPVGVIAGIYGFLVVFGGAALVLFLVGAIDGGKNKDFWVEVFSQFENALFTIPGVGLIPWRVRDTCRMGRIAHYQHLTWKLRKRQGLPALPDKNDVPGLPTPLASRKASKGEKGKSASKTSFDHRGKGDEGIELRTHPTQNFKDHDDTSSASSDVAIEREDAGMAPLPADQVLAPRQASNLHRLQESFAESQSWYRPHETFTHHAFSISYAVAITAFNDINSIFQCALCGVMWGYATHYHDRPAWTTGTFMPMSFLAGIASALLIWQGGEKSKKQREVEEKLLAAFAREIDEQVQSARRRGQAGALAAGQATSVPQLATVDEHPPNLDTLAHDINANLPPSERRSASTSEQRDD